MLVTRGRGHTRELSGVMRIFYIFLKKKTSLNVCFLISLAVLGLSGMQTLIVWKLYAHYAGF